MSYAILGAGAVGQALAKAFARKGVETAIASRKSPEELTPIARSIGPAIIPRSMQDAVQADVILLAVPYWAHQEVAKLIPSWHGKLIVDVTNAYGVPPEKLQHLASSVVISRALPGAKLVKVFNHLPAEVLAQDPEINGDRRVLFLSSDDKDAASEVAEFVKSLGYAPLFLGKLEEGGRLIQAWGNSWAPLIFQDLFKRGA
jgi:hypothetical protein